MSDLPSPREFDDFNAWSGRDVLASGGEPLGTVEAIFLDEATDLPEWVLVRLGGDSEPAFVPLAGANVEEHTVRVEQDRDRVQAAPRPEVGHTLSVADERRLYEHYGLAYSESASSSLLPESAGEEAPAERPRLRKFVGTPEPPAAASEPAASEPATAEPAASEPATAEPPAAGGAASGGGAATPIPSPPPRLIPPPGGFQALQEEESSGLPALLKRRPAVPIALAAAIVGLLALLALRRRGR